jgi:hypothetical protein
MRIRGLVIVSIAALYLMVPAMRAEEKTKPVPGVPLRITVVFTEFEGSKKLSNLPYVFPCGTSKSTVRIGYQVPFGGEPREYNDIGTALDCIAAPQDRGDLYILHLKVEHLTVYTAAQSSSAPVEWHPGAPLPVRPIFGNVEGEFNDLVMRDGQTVQFFSGTDSVSGHTWKVNVTLNATK